ncbi:MAG: dTDP-glucose 4,6-dehydratase [Candidatus Acidiferrum sp.]
MTRVLVTGGAGFIGSNFVHYLLGRHPNYQVVVLDKLTYAGNLRNLESLSQDPRLTFSHLDLCHPKVADVVKGCELVVHFAAESHVDRSIESAREFVRTNVEGTWHVMECCRQAKVTRFVHVSTDEVYGSLGPSGKFTETSPIAPNSPYSATKAASDLVVLSYVHTHGFPAVITRCSNNYGPYQFPEKFIPLVISQALNHQSIPVYGDGSNVRNWIHVEDHCSALDLILHHGQIGEVYNIGGPSELRNLEVACQILEVLRRPKTLIHFVTDRPGHDHRYAIDSSKLENALGWKAKWEFSSGLLQTIQWYEKHRDWVETARSGESAVFFQKQYSGAVASTAG